MVKKKYFAALIFYDFITYRFEQKEKQFHDGWVYTILSVVYSIAPQTHPFSLAMSSSLYSPLTNWIWHIVGARKRQLLNIFITEHTTPNMAHCIFSAEGTWETEVEEGLSDLPLTQL